LSNKKEGADSKIEISQKMRFADPLPEPSIDQRYVDTVRDEALNKA
jgi:hypothetical protein